MKEETKKENYIEFYVRKTGTNEPKVDEVEVCDGGTYYRIRIFTKDNPTFEIDQIS